MAADLENGEELTLTDFEVEEDETHSHGPHGDVILPTKFGEIEADAEKAPEVKRRVQALKKIQVDITEVEASFYREMHALECKYLPKYLPYFEKRRQIVTGSHEPNDDECDFVGESDSSEDEEVEMKENPEVEKPKDTTKENVKGIPDFWLTIFRNVDMLQELTEDHDEPILKHLTDITVEMVENPMQFTLLFHFEENPYFTNAVLRKTYEMNCDVAKSDPFTFEGQEIVRCKGCPIDWKEGQNVTAKTTIKKQKHKKSGSVREVTQTVETPSFFKFFSPLEFDLNSTMDDDVQLLLTNDFEIGQYIRERIIPCAVLFYTGEAIEEDDYDEEEEEEEEETGGEDNDDDGGKGEDENGKGLQLNPRSRPARRNGQKNHMDQNRDCKQQ